MARILETPLVQLVSSKSTTGNGNPIAMTGWLSTADIYTVRFARYLESLTSGEVRIFYECSDDGVVGSATRTAVGAFSSALEWVYLEGAATTIDTDVRNSVRFGLQFRNTVDTNVHFGVGRLRLEIDPTFGRTLVSEPTLVWCNGTTTQIFHPLPGLGPVPIQSFNQHRATLRLESDTAECNAQPAYQVSNDGLVWSSGALGAAAGTFGTFSSNRTANGIYYDGTFTSFSVAERKQLVRWGVAVQRESGGSSSLAEAMMATLRIDTRRV